jgi:hypothetical protein
MIVKPILVLNNVLYLSNGEKRDWVCKPDDGHEAIQIYYNLQQIMLSRIYVKVCVYVFNFIMEINYNVIYNIVIKTSLMWLSKNTVEIMSSLNQLTQLKLNILIRYDNLTLMFERICLFYRKYRNNMHVTCE